MLCSTSNGLMNFAIEWKYFIVAILDLLCFAKSSRS
jgi:hypothetical protein